MDDEYYKERRRRERGLTYSPSEQIFMMFAVIVGLLVLILVRQ